MRSYVIHLLRNGACEGNLEGRYIGRTESPLAMSSVKKLVEKKSQFQYPQAEAYFASPSTRCVDTLKILYPQADPEVIFEMAECDFGDWENKTAAELEAESAFQAWVKNGSQSAPPNGESGDVFLRRVCMGFEALVQNLMLKKKHSAVLVAHGGVLMSVLSVYGLPRANFYDWICEEGCGYSMRIHPSLWMRSQVAEVFETLPYGNNAAQTRDHMVIDLAREAADRAYGSEDRGSDEYE